MKKILSVLLAAALSFSLSSIALAVNPEEGSDPGKEDSTVGVSGEEDLTVGDSSEEDLTIGDSGEEDLTVGDSGEEDPTIGDSGEEDPTIGDSDEEEAPEPPAVFDIGQIEMTQGVRGIIDPFNMGGNGPIDYDPIKITNHGEVPVQVKLDAYTFESTGGIVLENAPLDFESTEKSIFLYLSPSEAYLPEQILSDGPMNADYGILEPKKTLTLWMRGQANYNSMGWLSGGNVKSRFHFTFEPVMDAPYQQPTHAAQTAREERMRMLENPVVED